jgi:hypothetical protein
MFIFFRSKEQANMLWLQDTKQNNADNQNSLRYEATRHFRNTKLECLKAEIEELETNSKLKNIRDLYRIISYFEMVTSLELK